MITADQLKPYRTNSDDYAETERLKSLFAKLHQTRQPFFLTGDEFDAILRWKLRGQYGRQQKHRATNTPEIIEAITKLALNITHPDISYELELRVHLLCALRGVAVPIASAILALVYPNEYAVIDFRAWRQAFGEMRTTFSIPNYKRYMDFVIELADELGWPVQEVDLAIWEYDRRFG